MMGCDEAEFIRIFLTRNTTHLAKLFMEYSHKHEYTMKKLVEKKFSGKLEKIMLTVVDSVTNRFVYFADVLESSMSGVGMDHEKFNSTIIRLRRTGEMKAVKEAYLQKYGKSLEKRVKGETSGDHEKLAVALIETPSIDIQLSGSVMNDKELVEMVKNLAIGGNKDMDMCKGKYEILNIQSMKCLDDTNGLHVEARSNSNPDSQRWGFTHDSNGRFVIKNHVSGNVLDVCGGQDNHLNPVISI
jgi:hypothetical protein